VDNTLLGNDRIQDDRRRYLEREFGVPKLLMSEVTR